MTTAIKTRRKPQELNSRQRHFCLNYASGMTQSEAYIKAGYNVDPRKGTASDDASRLMQSNAGVKAYYQSLCERKEQMSLAKLTEMVMQPQEVKARLSELARANLVDFIDEDGKVRLTRDTPHHSAAKKYYRKTRKDRDGNPVETSEITLVDQIEALRELAKIHGLYAPSRHMIAQKVQFEVRLVEKARSGSDDPVTASTDEGIANDST